MAAAGGKARIESLSDLIFGLALSISALSLIARPITDLSQIGQSILVYLFGFLILISVWLRYTRTMTYLRSDTPVALFLNVSLLFFVSVEPYLFNLMIASTSPVAGVSNEDWWLYVSSLYAVDLGSLFFILGMYNVAALSSGRGLLSGEDQRHLRASRNAAIVSAAFIFVSIAPAFGSWIVFSGVPMRAILWFAPLALMRGQRYLSRRPPFANRGPGSAPP
ncbi:MAG TPA: TMEM175 family protein [Thermoplasmata archaeon]|nr:TMEM175 family protein [Thermoplasmata archaeon]